MTQNNDNAIQNDFGQRILVKEVKSFSQIRQLDDKLAVTAIYELKEKENERIFASHPVQACHWLAEKFNFGALQNCFFICPYAVSIVKDWDIKYEHCSSMVTVTLDLEVKLDVEQSDSGRGLVNWLAGHGWRMDQSSLENYLESKITSGFLENTQGLYNRPWREELKSGCLELDIKEFQKVVGSWLAVNKCKVIRAEVKESQSWLDRNKTLKENARIQQKHQDELDALHRENEILQARLENQALENAYQSQKQKMMTDAEKTRLDEKYKMISDMYTYRTEEKKKGGESTSSNVWPVGHMINEKYMVVADPAAGSIGEVYKCWDVKGSRDVAVKRLPNGSSQTSNEMEGVWENFQLISPLDHQNIARYLALDIDNKTHDNFLVMDFVEGEELRVWMNRLREVRDMARRLEIALPVLRMIASALDDVHKKNVIHRDVKPDNVKIKSDGTVKVLDFGLAEAIDPVKHKAHIPNKVIASAGSDSYKSPEQWYAMCEQGPSVDQYSLAVMAYEMLSGQLPFKKDKWTQEVFGKKMLPAKVKGLPSYANKALQKALSMEAADRYPSCVEFVNAFGGVRRAWPAVAAVLMLIAVLGGVYAWKGQSFNMSFFWEKLNLHPTASIEVVKEKEEAIKALKKQLEDEKKKTAELEATVAAVEKAKKALEVEKGKAEEEAKRALEAEKEKAVEQAKLAEADKEALKGQLEDEKKTLKERLEADKKALQKQLEDEKKKTAEVEAKVAAWEKAKEKAEERAILAEYEKKKMEKQLEDEKKKTAELEAKIAAGETANGAVEQGKAGTGDRTLMLPGKVPLKLIHVAAGSFTMGSSGNINEEKQHNVTLSKDFWLGETEVTQKQWKAVMGSNPSTFKNNSDSHPVEFVSWNKAMEFCQKVTEHERSINRLPEGYEYTLPTEAQWEYAARERHENSQWNYSGSNIVDGVAWYSDNSNSKTHPVGLKKANKLKLYDMSGNVWEWCRDWFELGYAKDPEFLRGNFGSLRVLRGGSWNSSARNCRLAYRLKRNPSESDFSFGFRLALAPVQ